MFLYYIIFGIGLVAVVLWVTQEVKRFLTAYPAIDGAPALEAYKHLARRNMITTLIYLPLGLISFLWSIYLTLNFAMVGLSVVLAVQIPLILLSLNLKKLENRARSLDAADDTLREAHRRVSESWVKKALPDF